jgi:hypothetical protein
MAEEMRKHLVDPGLHAWIVPTFTTTTSTDRIIASVVMMATLKAYFTY